MAPYTLSINPENKIITDGSIIMLRARARFVHLAVRARRLSAPPREQEFDAHGNPVEGLLQGWSVAGLPDGGGISSAMK